MYIARFILWITFININMRKQIILQKYKNKFIFKLINT